MAKTYIDIIKYMVEAKFEIHGSVEKPDIIGAVFGQTEGLLGSGLDLRELQKNGKIGRIEIEASSNSNKTLGKLHLPSSLGRVETCILAAAIESVDRVGPFETLFKVEKIEDTRNEKRRKIITRAKDLVKNMLATEIPDSKEISELVETDVKASIISTYGPEALPAGPDIDKADELIIVEGRADVINLLRNDIENCIAVGGAVGNIPKTIIDLCTKKDTTLFVDGDRGGDIIIKGIVESADIDFIIKAPDGKEVEELTRKELIKALRNKIPIEQYLQHTNYNNRFKEQRNNRDRQQLQRETNDKKVEIGGNKVNVLNTAESKPTIAAEREKNEILSPSKIRENYEKSSVEKKRNDDEGFEEVTTEDIKSIYGEDSKTNKIDDTAAFPNSACINALSELQNTLRGRLYRKDETLIKEVPIRELIQSIQDIEGVYAIVFDGIITQRLIELAYRNGIKEVYGIRSNQILRKFQNLKMYTAENGDIS
ncbi:DNA primase DnaG [Candidatus Marsarchaeota archaeon]|nr:DNA primase DnaG [Candidatus Marsarchaeota archaeon]MCL5089970.1 DNA primase DnaG [Candidatus Marsarchaeota archaeon]